MRPKQMAAMDFAEIKSGEIVVIGISLAYMDSDQGERIRSTEQYRDLPQPRGYNNMFTAAAWCVAAIGLVARAQDCPAPSLTASEFAKLPLDYIVVGE